MRRSAFASLIGITAAMMAFAPHAANAQKTEGGDAAKKAVEQFCSKLEAGDLDALVKTAGTPFCFNGGDDPDKLVAEVAADDMGLKKLLKEFVDGSKGKKVGLKITATLTYAEFLKTTGDLLKTDGPLKKDRAALDQALDKDGYVLLARIGEEKKGVPIGFLVATRKGEAKVVGVLIGLTDPTKK